MADCLDDAEFLLPSQFLADEDFLMDRKSFFPHRAPAGGFGSGLSSPVDSLLGSLEAESDEEDLLAELSRKMAHSTLEEGFKAAADSKVRLLSGSPQSTLCPGWDLLCEAAGEVARLRLTEQLYGLSRSKGGGEALYAAPAGRRSPVPVPVKPHVSNGGFNYPHHQNPLSHHQLVANQIQQLKQQQALIKQQLQQQALIKQQQQQVQRRRHGAAWGLNTKPNVGPYQAVQTCGRKPDASGIGGVRRSPVAPAWPSVQQQNGAGMKAVFLGNPPSGKRERAGTGVFLPRAAGSCSEPRKKTACSTVLLPDKVVRALNLNLENIGSQPQIQYRLNGCLASDIDCVRNLRGNGGRAQQNQNSHSQVGPLNHEIRLPQEWTY